MKKQLKDDRGGSFTIHKTDQDLKMILIGGEN